MKKLILSIVLLFVVLSAGSCAFLQDVFGNEVVTTADNVAPGHESEVVPIPKDQLPAGVKEKLGDTNLVVIPKEAIKDPTKPAVALDGSGDAVGGLVSIGIGVASKIWPGLAALEGLGIILSRRKRQHYVDAVKAIAPTDGSVDVVDAAVSVARALGLAHSSEASKAAAEKPEILAPAEKLNG